MTSGRRRRPGVTWSIMAVLAVALFVSLGTVAGDDAPSLPVLLVYGFQPVPGFHPTRLWETFAERLSGRSIEEAEKLVIDEGHAIYRLPPADGDHFDVFLSHYASPLEPTIRDLRSYASRLSEEIAWVCSFRGVEAVDLVAHSMGGLVARCYIEAADFVPLLGTPDFTAAPIEYRGDVRTLVTLATPHHGAIFPGLGTWLGPLMAQLATDSSLLAALNAGEATGSALVPSVRYVAMAGQSCFGCGVRRDADACRRECLEAGLAWLGSDLVVTMGSARLTGAEHTACLGMNHVDMHAHPALADAVADVLRGQAAPSVVVGTPELRAILEAGDEGSPTL